MIQWQGKKTPLSLKAFGGKLDPTLFRKKKHTQTPRRGKEVWGTLIIYDTCLRCSKPHSLGNSQT